jgi:hypothetical protein
MKSQNTTNCIKKEKNGLTCQNICDILRICGETGVKDFKFQDLHVVFESKLHNDKVIGHYSSGQEDGISTIESKTMLAQEELNYRDEQLANLQLTDPLLYEELVSQGELINT